MPCKILSVASLAEAAPFLARLKRRNNPEDPVQARSTEDTVREILARVQREGVEALVDYTRRFDAPGFTAQAFTVPSAAIAAAASAIPAADLEIIREAAANIREFHLPQKEQSWFTTRPDGAWLGQRVSPVDRAGLYVPGGKGGATPLISTLLMNAIPAQIAGVPEIVVISPPRPDGTVNPYILAAAHLLGLTEIYAAGSAWAIAALAYGAGPLRPVDVIAGPGNIFVATAKRLLIGSVGIDMIAGPSEICILADHTANPNWIAADMLSQAEHDAHASAVCITSDRELAKTVAQALTEQCPRLPRREIAKASLKIFGAILLVPDMEVALDLINAIAPEHLETFVAEPLPLLPRVRHAGAIFIGDSSAEALGDYFAGPNHVLPTMGTARFTSALGVSTFCKKTSLIAAGPIFARNSADAVARLARLEGLEAHARSALCRKEPPDRP